MRLLLNSSNLKLAGLSDLKYRKSYLLEVLKIKSETLLTAPLFLTTFTLQVAVQRVHDIEIKR